MTDDLLDVEQNTEPPEEPKDETPPEETPPEEKPEGDDSPPKDEPPEDPPGFTKAINRKHHQYEEEKRRGDALQEELARLRAQVPEVQRPVIPDLPDPYDADYADKVKIRDQAIHDAAEHDAKESVAREQQKQAFEQQQKQAQETIIKTVTTYEERAQKLGMSKEDVQATGNAVAAYGMSPDLQMHILTDDQGPLITSFLAKHPDSLEAMRGKTLIECGVYIETVIKPKATAASGRSNTPPPPDSLGGGGAPPARRGPPGATYE